MRQGHRFIGGPLHGKFRVVQAEAKSVVVSTTDRAYAVGPEEWPEYCFLNLEYRREYIALGRNTRVEVFALDTMTEDEKWRRLADLIEGCTVDTAAHKYCTLSFCRRRGDSSCPCR